MSVILRLAILLVLCSATAGCAYKDIDKRYFVAEIGFDKGARPNLVKVTLKMLIPTSSPKERQKNFQIISAESPSIAESIQKLRAKADKQLDFTQTKGFVIGEALIAESYLPVMDWAILRPDVQKVSFLTIGSPTAADILNKDLNQERIPGNSIFLSMAKLGEDSQYIPDQVHLFDLMFRATEPGIDPVLNILEVQGDSLRINKLCVLDKQKVRVRLKPDETELLSLLMNPHQPNFYISVPYKDHSIVYQIAESEVKYSLGGKPDQPVVRLSLKSTMLIKSKPFDRVYTPSEEAELRAIVEKKMETLLQRLLTMLRDKDVDPLGFGLRYRAKHWQSKKTELARWKELYPKLIFEVSLKAQISSEDISY